MVEENTDGQTVYNVYDAMGNRTDFSLFRGTTEISSISYGYNSNGWMTSMSGNGTSATYAYDGNGNRTSTTYGNGNVVSYTYNAANYPTLVANRSGSNTISSFVYTYALDGNVATKTDHTGKVTEYTYDGMNRLTEEVQKKNGVLVQSYAYTFDDFNNRSTLTAAGADAYTVAYSYDKNNRLLEDIKTSTDETAKTLYFYDPNGNQIGRSMETLTSSQDAESISATTAVASYEKSWYNGFNQMVGTKVDGVEATYSYAPSGLRLSKTIDGTTIDYALDGDFVAAELNGDSVTARYNRGLELVGSTIGDTTSYYLYNAHGDVVNLTNTSGAATKSYEYDAFGNEVNPAADDTNPFRYCGEYFDAETGRIYLRARYYDPVLGRMLAEDSAKDGINWYVYCSGNPNAFVDPSGNMPVFLLRTISDLYNNNMISQQQASTFALLANINNVYLGFHEIAQINLAHQLFEKKESPILEYEIISKTQKNKWGWPKRYEADLVSHKRVWEVKPVGKSGRSDLNRYMSEGDLLEGRNLYSMTDIPVFGNFKMKISVVGGLANYSFYCYDFQGNAVPVLSKDVKAAYENNANNAAKAFASIAGLTILEDLITGGYGVVDDLPSLTLALGAAAAALT